MTPTDMTVNAPTTANGKAEQAVLTLPRPTIHTLMMTVIGTSPLICHAWSEKAKKEMLDRQMKQASQGKEAKDPERDYQASLYPHPDRGYGFPCVAFKAAAVRAGTYCDMKMTFLRGAFHVKGELARIQGDPQRREDMVRVGNGVADIRYRGEFPDWKTTLRIEYNARAISAQQIVSLFEIAGFSVGVGEWRPERDGSYGTFVVDLDTLVEM